MGHEQDHTLNFKRNLAENGLRFNSLDSTYRKIVKGMTAPGRSAVIMLLNPAECLHTIEIGVLCKYLEQLSVQVLIKFPNHFRLSHCGAQIFKPPQRIWERKILQVGRNSSPFRHFKMTVLGISMAFHLPFLRSKIANRVPIHFSCEKDDGFAFIQESW